MATIVDALLVTLGLDVKDYKKGADEAEKAQKKLEDSSNKSAKKMTDEEKKLDEARKKQAKEQEARAKAMGQGLAKMRNEALGLLAVFTAGMGIKDFVTNTINSEASLSRMSQNLNMTAKELAEYKLANEMAGGSAEGMVAQLQQSAADIANLKIGKGPSEAMQNFFRFGGSSADLKDANTYLKARSDIIAKIYKTDPTKAVEVAKSMGISEDTFNLLKLGSVELERHKEAQAGLAGAQAANAARAEALRQKMATLKNTFETAGTELLTGFMPVFEKLLKYLQQFANWVNYHQADIKKWADAAVEGISKFVDFMKVAIPFITGLISMMFDGWKGIVQIITSLGDAIEKILPSSIQDKIGEFVASIAIKGGAQPAGTAFTQTPDILKSKAGTAFTPSMPDITKIKAGAASRAGGTSNTSSADVKINQVNIYTHATNGAAVAKEFTGALVKNGVAAQANTGMH